MSLGWWRGPSSLTKALARTVGLGRPVIGWRKLAGPYYGNAISTLRLDRRSAEVITEGTTKDGDLRLVHQLELTAVAGRAPRAGAALAAGAAPAKTEGLASAGSA
jgi:hypothetical protein